VDGDDELRGPRLRCDLLTQTGDMDVHAPRQQRLILPTPPTAAASMSSIQHHRRGAAVPAVRRLCRRPIGRLNASVPLEHTPTSLRFTARRDRRRSRRAIGRHAIRTGFQLEANRITRTCSAAQRAPSPSRASKRSRAASRRPSRTTLGDPRVAVARTSSPPAIRTPFSSAARSCCRRARAHRARRCRSRRCAKPWPAASSLPFDLRLNAMVIPRRGSIGSAGINVSATASPVTEVQSIGRFDTNAISVNVNDVRPQRRIFAASSDTLARSTRPTVGSRCPRIGSTSRRSAAPRSATDA